MAIKRGRESALHRAGKLALGRLLASRGFLVLFEHLLADVVAFRRAHSGLRTVCGEHDTTIRNVRSNVRRDFANGCRSLVILVSNESARAAVRRLLRREFPRDIQTRIGVITYDACYRQLGKLPPNLLTPVTSATGALEALPLNTNKQPSSNKRSNTS